MWIGSGLNYIRVPTPDSAPIEKKNSSRWVLLVSLLSIGFIGFSLYVIICSHIPAVSNACKDGLWITVVVHLSVAVMFPLILCLGLIFAVEYERHVCTLTAAAGIWLLYLAALFTLGIQFGYQAVQNTDCNVALSSATTFNAPMLAILAFINAGFDCLLFIVSTWACCCWAMCA